MKHNWQSKLCNAGIYCVNSTLLKRYVPLLCNDMLNKSIIYQIYYTWAVDEGKSVIPIYVQEEEFKGVTPNLTLQCRGHHANRIKKRLMEQGLLCDFLERYLFDWHATFEGECLLENGGHHRGLKALIMPIQRPLRPSEDGTIWRKLPDVGSYWGRHTPPL